MQDSEDIVQDVFYRFIKADHLVLPVDEALPWLFRVARNAIIDFWRKRKGLLFSDTEDDELEEVADLLLADEIDSPEELYLKGIFWETFHAAMNELPPEQQDIVRWTEFDGLSYNEIADKTGVNINTLLSRKRYATKHLRERLKDVRDLIFGE
jgi:RNA polymerase sigma factor (sigma-70 family)